MIDLLRKLPGKFSGKSAEEPEPAKAAAPLVVDDQLPRGTETVLLAEDEQVVREYMATLLGDLGYKVLPAAHGEEALQLAKQIGLPQIDLLITDIIMPQMGGKELVYRLRNDLPKSRVIFCSAYPGELATRHGMLLDDITFLQKPVTAENLAKTVRQRLDAAKHAEAENAGPTNHD
jgi:two-component system, cell cycle sensor histidine kinase and response regulator CckA